MILQFTLGFKKKAAKLTQKEPKLQKKLQKQFKLFQNDQKHRSLKLHKLKGDRNEQYAIWIHGDLRAVATKDGEMYIFFDLVTHDEY